MDNLMQRWERVTSLWKKNVPHGENLPGDRGEDREVVRQVFEIRQAMNGLEKRKYDVERGWRKVRPQTRGMVRLRSMVKYVAVLFFLSLGMYFVISHKEAEENNLAGIGNIKPGTSQAELHLATGEYLVLNVNHVFNKQVKSGIEIRNDTASGKVYYRTSDVQSIDSSRFNTLVVPKGGEYSLELSDGTIVWVNSESSLRFPEVFARTQREVFLQGEAYFEVKKDTDKPFVVRTEMGDIRVLGTSFNVSAYPTDELWQATLVEGQVSICRNQGEILMKPNEQYQMDRITGKGVVRSVIPEFYTSWRDGKFYFKAYTFEELVERLERWYDFKMFYTNENIKSRRFSGVVNKHQPLQEMLKFLEMTSDVRFHVKGNVVTASLLVKEKNGHR